MNKHLLGACPGPDRVLYILNPEMNEGSFLPPRSSELDGEERQSKNSVECTKREGRGDPGVSGVWQREWLALRESRQRRLPGGGVWFMYERIPGSTGLFTPVPFFLTLPLPIHGMCFGGELPLDGRVARNSLF